MATGWNVRQRGDKPNSPLTWQGRPWKVRTGNRLNEDRRWILLGALLDVPPRILSGMEVVGTTSQELKKGEDVYDEFGKNSVVIYAKPFEEQPQAWAWTDPYWKDGGYVAAVVIFNSGQYDNPSFNQAFSGTCHHELGHVAGLLHPSSSTQHMSSSPAGLPWRTGDLDGFAHLRAHRFD